eukprot:scpid48854/ scgid32397/ 
MENPLSRSTAPSSMVSSTNNSSSSLKNTFADRPDQPGKKSTTSRRANGSSLRIETRPSNKSSDSVPSRSVLSRKQACKSMATRRSGASTAANSASTTATMVMSSRIRQNEAGSKRQQYEDLERQFLERVRQAQVAEDANKMGRGQRLGATADTTQMHVSTSSGHIRRDAWESFGFERQLHLANMVSHSGSVTEGQPSAHLKDIRLLRTDGDADTKAETDGPNVSFDPHQNHAYQWRSRYFARRRFVQAAWKVIFRLRADRVIAQLLGSVEQEDQLARGDRVEEFGNADADMLSDAIASMSRRISTEQSLHVAEFTLQECATGSESAPLAIAPSSDAPLVWHSLQGGFEDLPPALCPSFDSLYEHVIDHIVPLELDLFSGFSRPAIGKSPAMGKSDFSPDTVLLEKTSAGDSNAATGEHASGCELLRMPAAFTQSLQMPSLYAFDPAGPEHQKFSAPMPFTELDPAYELLHPVRRLKTSVTDDIDRLLKFQHETVSGLTITGCTPPLSAVSLPRYSARFHSDLFPAPLEEQHGLSAEDAEVLDCTDTVFDSGTVPIQEQIELEQVHVIPSCVLEPDEEHSLLVSSAHQLPATAKREDIERALMKQFTEGSNRIGTGIEKRLAEHAATARTCSASSLL